MAQGPPESVTCLIASHGVSCQGQVNDIRVRDTLVSTHVTPTVGKRAPAGAPALWCQLNVAVGHLPRQPGADKMSRHNRGPDPERACQDKSVVISAPHLPVYKKKPQPLRKMEQGLAQPPWDQIKHGCLSSLHFSGKFSSSFSVLLT